MVNVQIRDAAALRRVSPAMLRAYLEARGWVHEETWRDRILVWSNTNNGQPQQVLVPLREETDTYAVRISEAVALLADVEARSQIDVYHDLIGAGVDSNP